MGSGAGPEVIKERRSAKMNKEKKRGGSEWPESGGGAGGWSQWADSELATD